MSNLTCDVLIIGAGPAGLAAACTAAQSGQSVLMLDDNPNPGGQIWRDGPGVMLPVLAQQYRQAVGALNNVTLLNAVKIVAHCGRQQILYEGAVGSGLVDYQRLILCCGARELLLPFPGWTLPGVTGAGGLQAQIKQGLQIKGERVAIAGSGPLLLAVADSVTKAGGDVVLLAEQTSARRLAGFASGLWRWPTKLHQSLTLLHRRYRPDSYVLAALGGQRLEAVRVQQGRRVAMLPCDRLACGFGLVANIELAMHLGCRISNHRVAVDEWQQTSVPQIYAAGDCTGVGGSELALAEGAIAGYAATGNMEQAQALMGQRDKWRHFAGAVERAFMLNPALKALAMSDTLLCRCEDVPLGQVCEFSGWSAAKLGSRCGMGACQGKICATAARHLFGWPLVAPRIPLTPARTETLARLGRTESDG
ncbi:FAD/NAD(P)-binding oxidoreductase [Serratia plymuthica]|uniref:NAD(P)/FAD-dependent oxidoreductase n=2 Tax=Serratia plymuthica TaxID=82996 RepID=A0A7T2STP1_SERPL|nr:FAD/NAD(P)-binding oxidoreductase [Serratia plymuthica]QPS21426.1 NAD(P)/FAD-dependent oxidoreductase [Serratia plymuthica]QPS54309.1 NAD(P)/FAD-dependent oxidoreductase [Serratia plymuthica]QPS63035.1 NAD(P)/FAD-dependent oxidoreductase [Serratia plymuthica]RKS64630.1 thioredoxin reductase [Serratia plymuthica]UNK26455.1 NAD(P)/FAD-dependent oxidoreductase [Serratia plymuthica]